MNTQCRGRRWFQVQRCLRSTLLALALGFPIAGEVIALSTVPTDLKGLVESSEEIIHGRIVSTRSHWNEAHTLIVTEVRVLVLEAIRGEASGEIRFTHPGGVVGALRVEIPGVSPFRLGQENVLFLSKGPGGHRYVMGLEQGRFEVQVDRETARRSVRAQSHDHDGSPPRDVEDLTDFLERVRTLARR